jgi:hypothetical protein
MTDWIKHDGTRPSEWCKTGDMLHIMFAANSDGLIKPVTDTLVYANYPGFYWRWCSVRTGWFKREQRRICDDPAYAPIIAYRFSRDTGTESGMKVLQQILRDVERLAPHEKEITL